MKRNILLNPGPATTTDTVKMAQVVPDICPREAEFGQIMTDISDSLLKIVHAPADKYSAVLFCGSGTLMMDVCVNSLVKYNGEILFINNGAYTARAVEIAKAYGISYTELNLAPYELPDLATVEKILQDSTKISLVYVTHQETGTGLLNPIREIGEIAHRCGSWLLADTTSTLAMRPIDVQLDNVDFCMASAQKGIQAMTGLSYIIGRTDYIELSKDFPRRSYYANLFLQYESFIKTGQMRFTPPVQAIYAARQALKEYFSEGELSKWQRHQAVIKAIHDGLQKLGFREVLPLEKQAGLVIAIQYPNDDNWNFNQIHDYCYERGYTIYPGKMQNKGTFRLCALGAINSDDIKNFFAVFTAALKECKVSIPIKY